MSTFLPPSQTTSPGGGGSTFSGLGIVATPIPPRARPFPWPLPFSATQGAVGGPGAALSMVQVAPPPYYGPFQPYWPYQVPRLNGLPNPVVF